MEPTAYQCWVGSKLTDNYLKKRVETRISLLFFLCPPGLAFAAHIVPLGTNMTGDLTLHGVI